MAPAPQFYDSTSTSQISAIITANLNAGTTLAAVVYNLWNDKGALLAATTLTNARIRPVVFDGSAYATEGFPVLDDAWVQIKLTGITNTGDPAMETQVTPFTPVGANRHLVLRNIPQNCARTLEVQIVVPAGANNLTEEVHLEIVADEASVVLGSLTSLAPGGGVIPSWFDSSARTLTGTHSVTTAGTDVVTVLAESYAYDGRPYYRVNSAITLNQTSASGALAVGESYIAVLSQQVGVATVTSTKGNRAGSPTAPATPSGHIYLGKVTVAYQGGGTSIINAGNVDTTGVPISDFAISATSGLGVSIAPGKAISTVDTYVFPTAATALSLTDNATSHIWLRPDGTVTFNTGAVPVVGSIYLGNVTTAGGAVLAISPVQRHTVGRAVDEFDLTLKYPGAVTATMTDVAWDAIEVDAILDSVSLEVGTAAVVSGANTIKIDVNSRVAGATVGTVGTTIYTSQATDDKRPTATGTLRSARNEGHEVRGFGQGSRFSFDIDQIPGGTVTTEANDILVKLHFRRLQL